MGTVVGLFAFALAVVFPILLVANRRRLLRGLASTVALRRVAAGFFDGAPAEVTEGDRARLEGTRRGEPIAVEAAFTPAASARYLSRGYRSRISAEVTVLVGLQGASPLFSFEATSNARAVADEVADEGRAPSERQLARAWTIRADPDLVDDDLRTDLMRLLIQVRSAQSVRIDREGLRITWRDDAGVQADPTVRRDAEANASWEKGQTERLTAAGELALRLRGRVLAALDRRGRTGVRVEAYRGAGENPARVEDEDAPAERAADAESDAQDAETARARLR